MCANLGENMVMLQQLARYLMKHAAAARSGKAMVRSGPPEPSFLTRRI